MLGLGLAQGFAFPLPTSTESAKNVILAASSVVCASQLYVIYQQWRHMHSGKYRPPSVYEPEEMPSALAAIRRSLVSRALGASAATAFDLGMLFGGGYDALWYLSTRAGSRIARSTGLDNRVLSAMTFGVLSMAASSAVPLVTKALYRIISSPPKLPSAHQITDFFTSSEFRTGNEQPRWKSWLLTGSIVTISIGAWNGTLEWVYGRYGKPSLTLPWLVTPLISLAIPAVLGASAGGFIMASHRTTSSSSSCRIFPPPDSKHKFVPLSEWQPEGQWAKYVSLDKEGLEDRLKEGYSGGGVDYSFWVEKIPADLVEDMDAVGKQSGDDMHNPYIRNKTNVVIHECQLVGSVEEQIMAHTAAAIASESRPPILIPFLIAEALLVDGAMLLAVLTHTILSRPDLCATFFPSARPPYPMALALTVASTMLEPMGVWAVAIHQHYMRTTGIFREDDKLAAMSPRIRQGLCTNIWGRDLDSARRGRSADVDVGSSVGWYSAMFLATPSASERIYRLYGADEEEVVEAVDREGDRK